MTASTVKFRAGRGQAGPCPTDEAHRPLPERRPYVSRYAGARTLQQRSLRQTLQVESFYLLCSRPTQLLAHIQGVACYPICQVTAGLIAFGVTCPEKNEQIRRAFAWCRTSLLNRSITWRCEIHGSIKQRRSTISG